MWFDIKEPVEENNLHLLHNGNKDIKIYSPGKIIYIPRATASGIMILPGGIICTHIRRRCVQIIIII